MTALTNIVPVAIDTETFLIGQPDVLPRIVCGTFAEHGKQPELLGNHPDDQLKERLAYYIERHEFLKILANAAFDFTAVVRTWPDLTTAVFDMYAAGRVLDVQHREKLKNLSTHGNLKTMRGPHGSSMPIKYSLAHLVRNYTGKDRTGDKLSTAGDLWRLNFSMLDGWKAADYPEQAAEYALEDATDALDVFFAQEQEASMGVSFATQELQAAADFALLLYTSQGVRVNQDEVAHVKERLAEELDESKLRLLLSTEILRPAVPSSLYKAQVKKAINWLVEQRLIMSEEEFSSVDLDSIRDDMIAAGFKFTAPKPSGINKKRLQQYVKDTCSRLGRPVKLSEKGQKLYNAKEMASDYPDPELVKYVATDSDFVSSLAPHDPVLDEYAHRQSLQKIVSTFLPSVEGHDRVHVPFDVLKETTRTSSYRSNLFPSIQGQNVPRAIKGLDLRRCFIPDEGVTFAAADYSSLELACVGQTTWDLFHDEDLCVHRKRVNQGVDMHGYLGAQLAYRFADQDDAFARYLRQCADVDINDPMHCYNAFVQLKSHSPESKKWWKKWRTLAKPIGLGFPGGLGPATMVTTARTTYGVIFTEAEAKEFRDLWRHTYPEMVPYFEWVEMQKDDLNQNLGDDDSGKPVQGLWYQSPLGMVRRGASYCAVANGKAMQTPAAEGAKIAIFNVARACYDPTLNSVLYGCKPWNFVHDEIIIQTTPDESLWHEQAMELSRIMEASMTSILRDVKVEAEPYLMSAWSKGAEPVFDENNRLIPWTPEPHKIRAK